MGDETLVPTTGWLAGWVAVGLLVGVAIAVGGQRAAMLIPASVAAMLIVGWGITRLRGAPVSGGTWMIAAGVAATGALVDLDRPVDRRIGGALLVLAGYVNLIAVFDLARR